jgi:hypothetical protein
MNTMTLSGLGNKSEANTEWCNHCGWYPPGHKCPVTIMSAEDEAAALASLNAVTAAHPAKGSGTWYTTQEGWQIDVFDDACEWDYIERIVAPDGRSWFYPFEPEGNRAMTDALANWKPTSSDGWPNCPELP